MKKILRYLLLPTLIVLLLPANVRAIEVIDGVYQISNAADFAEFGKLVAGGSTNISGVLTADIDMVDVTWTPIGDLSKPFGGTLNGQGHKISNLVINSTDDYQALFGVVTDGATFTNFVVDNTCYIHGGRYCAGIAGGTSGTGTVTFMNVGNEATVTGTGVNAAGIVGVSMSGTTNFNIINCYNTGDITGSKQSAAICAYVGTGSKIVNVFNTGTIKGIDSAAKKLYRNTCSYNNIFDIEGAQGDSISAEMLASGELAFKLNSNPLVDAVWHQNIDNNEETDAYPVPISSHGEVFAVGTLNCDGSPSEDVASYSNTNTSTITPHDYSEGVCTVCHSVEDGYAPSVNGVYQIGTASQLYWFANLVSSGTVGANAVITADIDYSEYTTTQAMIGKTTFPYSGTFDGQQHTITLSLTEPTEGLAALFRHLNAATIRNLATVGEISTEYAFAAGIFGASNGASLIENCVSSVEISSSYEGDNTNGGIGCYAYSGATIRNCSFLGSINNPSGTGNGGIMGYANGGANVTIENCFINGSFDLGSNSTIICRNKPTVSNVFYTDLGTLSADTKATLVDLEDVGNGALCYLLNSMQSDSVSWYQNLDNESEIDEFPMPFSTHGVVYAVGTINCDGTPASGAGYSNTNNSVTLPHDYQDGVCSFCGIVKADYMTPADGWYEISTPQQLAWFARYVNAGNTEINGRLMNDIDFSEQSANNISIGDDAEANNFSGIFDGQGHTVTLNYNKPAGKAALFIGLSNATIKNLHTTGTIVSGYKAGGIFISTSGFTRITNCISSVEMSGDISGDATFGGISAAAKDHAVYKNCAFVGSISLPSGTGNGGILGYANGKVNVVLENCFVAATITAAGNSAVFARNTPTIQNCYYIDPGVLDINSYTTEINETQLTGGELCFLLNGNVSGGTPWTQEIGTDRYPMPFGKGPKVYATGTLNCDATPVDLAYSNTEGELTKPEHDYSADGICGNCMARKISTPQQLLSLSEDINTGFANPDIDVIVDCDIDMKDISGYEGIGTSTIPFQGTFDGQGHVISNLKIETTTDYQGLFGAVSGGATIKNITVDSSCSISTNNYAAGILGGTFGTGLVIIENCGNEASVNANTRNAAGIMGVNKGTGALVRITNCYNAGTITGTKENAAISGWLGSAAEVNNCYNIGTVSGFQAGRFFARYSGTAYFDNCYDNQGTQVTTTTDEEVASGALCYMLNGSVSGGDNFFQTLGTDTHPVLTESHSKVYEQNGKYYNDVVGIKAIDKTVSGSGTTKIYTLDGMRVAKLQKGVNIVRKADGTTQKILVK